MAPSPTSSHGAVLTATKTLLSGVLVGATTLELLAPLGAGKAAVPFSVLAQFVPGSTPYTASATTSIQVWDGTANVAGLSGDTDIGMQGATPGETAVSLYRLVDTGWPIALVDAPSGTGLSVAFASPPAAGNGKIVFQILYYTIINAA